MRRVILRRGPASGNVPGTIRPYAAIMSSKGWSVVLGGVAAASLAAMVPLSVFAQLLGEGIVALVIGVPCMAVGFVVARRQPRNPLGWLFLVIAIFLFVPTVGGDYAYLNYQLGHALPFAAAGLAVDGLWSEGLALFIVAILLFPDGRLPSRFWRWALRVWCAAFAALLIAFVVATVAALAAHPIRTDTSGGLVALDNPVGWFAAVNHGCLVVLLTLSVAFIGRQLLSWRRSSGERRQQLKWLASGAAVSIVSLVLAAIFASSSGSQATVGQWIDNVAWFGLAALPVSIGVAILRYRLYDIDRIISRTLAYALVTGLLVGVFAGLVLLTTDVLSLSSPVAVAASTLAAAALFNPLRQRVQRVVDRRFNRTRYNADRTVAAFAAGLKDAMDVTAVREDLTSVVQQTLEPAHVSLWISPPA
jgi:hypothetical protein